MATQPLSTLQNYTEHCQRVEADYKHLHQQHLTVFGAFQRLQQAATGLRKSTERINKSLDSSLEHSMEHSVTDEELSRMLDEQEMIMNKLRLMEKENAGLMGKSGEGGDPMYNDRTFVYTGLYPIKEDTEEEEKTEGVDEEHAQAGGGPSLTWSHSTTTPTHHPRQSRHPPYDGYHDSHIAPYKKNKGGGARGLNASYLEYVQQVATAAKPAFTSFYGYTNALVDIQCPHESFAAAAKHNPTLNYPFRRMLSEIVGNVRWCDYVFHHRIPGMFTMAELEQLSALKVDAYNPCLKVVMTDDEDGTEMRKWQTLFKNDYEQHNHRTRIVFDAVPEVQYFLPAFEKKGDTLTLLFHVARGSRKESGTPPATLSYSVVTSTHKDDAVGELVGASVLDDFTNRTRNTFRAYAFFHASTVSDDTGSIIAECIEEFKAQHTTIADTWANGYKQLRKAVTATASSGDVHALLSSMSRT